MKVKRRRVINVDATSDGLPGRPHVLMAIAKSLCRQQGKDFEKIKAKLEDGKDEDLAKRFVQEFGDIQFHFSLEKTKRGRGRR
jgi:hypothetical protein